MEVRLRLGRLLGSSVRRSLSGGGEEPIAICGAGVTGLSTALHVARLTGHQQRILLFESDSVGHNSGSQEAWVSPHHLWQSRQVQVVAASNHRILSELAEKHPEIGYLERSSFWLASSDMTLLAIQRMYSSAKALGVNAQLLSTEETKDRLPFADTTGIKASLLLSQDRVVDMTAMCKALASEAIAAGVEIREESEIVELELSPSHRVDSIATASGAHIPVTAFLDTSGLRLGSLRIRETDDEKPWHLPVQPATYALLSASAPEAFAGTPQPHVLDMDAGVFLGSCGAELRLGGWRADATRSVALAGLCSASTSDWDLFFPVLEALQQRFPGLSTAKLEGLRTRLEMYTPDGVPVVGAHPHVPGYYLAGGLCGYGGSLGLGLGELLARWAVRGGDRLRQDVSLIEVERFLDLHANPHYLLKRAPEIAGLTRQLIPVNNSWKTARGVRKSPIYSHLAAAGAEFGECMGYERPLCFKSHKHEEFPRWTNFGRPPWLHYVSKEYEACRERVAVIDMSHFSKYDIWSESEEDVLGMLQQLCSSDVGRPVGTTVYTGVQNEDGGYVTDCTLSRLGPSHFFMVAPTVQQVRCRQWLEKGIREWAEGGGGPVQLQDSTSFYTALNVLGPESRHLLSDLTGLAMTPDEFPAFAAREMEVGVASGIRAISVTHCGELGWVLYVPNEFAQGLYEEVVRVGAGYGLAHAGYLALRHLRIEKFYVYWGMDIDSSTTPRECGRQFRVDMRKDFIGRSAIASQMQAGIRRRSVQLLIEKHNLDYDPWPQGEEPVFRDGIHVGWTTTAAYGFTLRQQVALAMLDAPADLEGPFEDWITQPGHTYTIMVNSVPIRAKSDG